MRIKTANPGSLAANANNAALENPRPANGKCSAMKPVPAEANKQRANGEIKAKAEWQTMKLGSPKRITQIAKPGGKMPAARGGGAAASKTAASNSGGEARRPKRCRCPGDAQEAGAGANANKR